MIKWVPRAARQHCASLLTKIINKVSASPHSVRGWEYLLAFGRDILQRPIQGGSTRNITNILTQRCRSFGEVMSRDGEVVPAASARSNPPPKRGKGPTGNLDHGTVWALSRVVSARLEEGNFKGAVRLITSEESLAMPSTDTLKALQDKHPAAPLDRRPAAQPSLPSVHLSFEEATVRKAIFSFPAGSSGGPDGLSPQHLKDLVVAEGVSSGLLTALTALVNILTEGQIPEEIRPFFFGGRLVALDKKGGGIRPIAIGLTLRRLASKLVSSYASALLASTLAPLQVGVGVPRGVEAAVHGTRAFVKSLGPGEALVKLDFTNAFNCIRRDSILEAVAVHAPMAYPYVHAAYAETSFLGYEGHAIPSAEGVQQGDPLGPLLFCLALHPVLDASRAEFRLGYLDDVTLGGELNELGTAVESLRSLAADIGLTLNVGKCEVVSTGPMTQLPNSMVGFRILAASEAVMLGAPLFAGKAMDDVWEGHRASLELAGSRLINLNAHDSLVILKHSLSLPKLLFHLRCTYTADHPALSVLDGKLRDLMGRILNVDLSDQQWIQATLPVKWGGLGIRRSTQVAPSAFLASTAGVEVLGSSILPQGRVPPSDGLIDTALASWRNQGGVNPPSGSDAQIQKCWDQPLIKATSDSLLQAAGDDHTKARLLASLAPHAGDWLNAPPISSVGLRLTNEALRVAVGLRLGATICSPHDCRCSAPVDARGYHGLSCMRSAGRQQRHYAINDIVSRALTRAKVASCKEPAGLIPGSNLRPDGATLIPWSRGKCLAWDATCADTMAASHLSTTCTSAGAAANQAATLKQQKYAALASTHTFVPLAVETFGPWNSEGLSFISELGRRTTVVTGDPRETTFLFQRLSIAVQYGNAVSCAGTFPLNAEDDE